MRISFCSISCWVYLININKLILVGIVELCFLHFLITVTKGLAKVQEGRKKEGGQEGARGGMVNSGSLIEAHNGEGRIFSF